MTVSYLVLFSTLLTMLYRTAYNPVLLFHFMLIFQLAVGPIVRMLGYPFADDPILTLAVSLYTITSAIFIMSFFKAFRIKPLSKTLKLDFISDKIYRIISVTYVLLIVLFLVELLSEVKTFSILEFRLFYHENRTSSYLPLLFLGIGAVGPFLAIISLSRRKYIVFALILLSILIIGKKAPFFTIIIFYIFLVQPKPSLKSVLLVTGGIIGLLTVQQLQSTANLSAIKILSGYFDYHINLIDVLERVYARNCCLGIFSGEVTVSKIWYFIPRFMHEMKPDIYSHLLIHSEFYPNELAKGYTRGIVSNISGAFADLGFLGILVYSLFNSFLFCGFLKLFSSEKNPFLRLLYLIIAINPLNPMMYLLGCICAASNFLLQRASR